MVNIIKANSVWECIPDDGRACPAGLKVDCEDNLSNIKCNCHTEVWSNFDCSAGFKYECQRHFTLCKQVFNFMQVHSAL